MSIRVERLGYTYNKGTSLAANAFEDISFSVDHGEWVSIVGHTGSGKSTLVQHLNALLFATSGKVLIDDFLICEGSKHLREVRKNVGLVFQYPEQQLFAENVREEIAFAPRNWGVPEDKIQERVTWALDSVGLSPDLLDANPLELSGGQKRRVAIASVLSARPRYLILDEPTAGLDAKGSRDLFQTLCAFQDQGIATIHVTHDLELALSTSTKILVLDGGKSVVWGTPEEVADELLNETIHGMVLPTALQMVKELRLKGIDIPAYWDVHKLVSTLEALRNSCNSQII